ncbi:olfactory receptor 14J1-like [Melozone crissalis]|uniref:olfactory receptor 14J1-like n=1 Tax=Melozone crissalis TaxID=40204 RepID=UPI0023D9D718|nr:olfactory receptor 14J1-like [Melozone crissalis]
MQTAEDFDSGEHMEARTGDDMLPFDIKQTCRMIFNRPEMIVFKQEWEDDCIKQLALANGFEIASAKIKTGPCMTFLGVGTTSSYVTPPKEKLHYGTLLGSRACAHMAAAAWASAFLNALLHTANTFSLPLCHGNALDRFFCEIPHILKLSCSKYYLRERKVSVFTVSVAFGCFVFIVFSYVQIFRAVLRIPSEQGRHKAFSTCLPHLAVVSLFFSTIVFAHLKPPSISSPSLHLAVSVLYSVVPPTI